MNKNCGQNQNLNIQKWMWWIQWKVMFSFQYENYCQGQLCYEFIIIKPEMLCFIYCFLPKVLPFFMNINHPWSSWPISIWEEKNCFTPVILNWPVLVVEGKRLKNHQLWIRNSDNPCYSVLISSWMPAGMIPKPLCMSDLLMQRGWKLNV